MNGWVLQTLLFILILVDAQSNLFQTFKMPLQLFLSDIFLKY